ncbi:MAG: hypothetical protein R2753_05485 [Chitinophagales bacterium]
MLVNKFILITILLLLNSSCQKQNQDTVIVNSDINFQKAKSQANNTSKTVRFAFDSDLIHLYSSDSLITSIEILLDTTMTLNDHFDDLKKALDKNKTILSTYCNTTLLFPNVENDVFNKRSKFSLDFSTQKEVLNHSLDLEQELYPK